MRMLATGSINDAIAGITIGAPSKRLRTSPPRRRPRFCSPQNRLCLFSSGSTCANTRGEKRHRSTRRRPATGKGKTTSKEPEKKKKAASQRSSTTTTPVTARTIPSADFEASTHIRTSRSESKDQTIPQRRHCAQKGAEKIDITAIVVDMLPHRVRFEVSEHALRGQDPEISRTNPSLLAHQPRPQRATKPHGQILDFRGQQNAIDEAITLFSGISTGD